MGLEVRVAVTKAIAIGCLVCRGTVGGMRLLGNLRLLGIVAAHAASLWYMLLGGGWHLTSGMVYAMCF